MATTQQKLTTPPVADDANTRVGPLFALRSPNFRLFVAGQMVSLAGTWMQTVAQQWLVYSLTKSTAWLGIVTGASALPSVALAILGGQVADRFPRRSILLITQIASLLLAAALAILATNRLVSIQPWHLVVLAALMGAVNAFNMPAQQALVPEMVQDRKALANAIALNSLMFNTARFLGPILAGLILTQFGAAACFGLNSASYIAVIISLARMRLPHRKARLAEQSVWEGFAFIGQVRSVLRTISLLGTASLLVWSISTLYPVLASQFGHGSVGYTTIMTVNGIGAALGGVMVTTFGERFQRRYLVYGAPVLFCLAFLGLSFSASYPIALAFLGLGGFAMIVFGVSAQTKVQQEASDALRGRVMAVYSLVFSGMMPLGGLIIGFVADHLGTMLTIRLNALVCLAITITLFVWSQRDRSTNQIVVN